MEVRAEAELAFAENAPSTKQRLPGLPGKHRCGESYAPTEGAEQPLPENVPSTSQLLLGSPSHRGGGFHAANMHSRRTGVARIRAAAEGSPRTALDIGRRLR